jgi:tetraacyldisaccharide 4'-kinase
MNNWPLAHWIRNRWQRPLGLFKLLLPLSWCYRFILWLKHTMYQLGILKPYRADVPVWVVGNLTVGGTGKTPVVIALAIWLKDQGHHPGIISRGYGGTHSTKTPVMVPAQGDPRQFGDEPILLAKKTGCPVAIGTKRAVVIRFLRRRHQQINIILSDDGLQHDAIAQDYRIAIIDGQLGLGNGHLLPLGPLREPIYRLKTMNAVLYRDPPSHRETTLPTFSIRPEPIHNLVNPNRLLTPNDLKNKTIHAVAGIGNPNHFFRTLSYLGYKITPHAFSDHHNFRPSDLAFGSESIIIMTEKDAVKCRPLCDGRCWVLPVTADLPESWLNTLPLNQIH